MSRKQVPGPGEGGGRRFVAGRDKRQNLRSQLAFRDPFCFRIKRLQEMCQQVVWRFVRLLGQNSSTSGDDPVDLGFEKIERRAYSSSTQPRDKVGYAKDIERADFSNRIEIRCHGDANDLGVRSKSVRKNGALEYVQRHLRHFGSHLDGGVVP